jgi:hypothetical protein
MTVSAAERIAGKVVAITLPAIQLSRGVADNRERTGLIDARKKRASLEPLCGIRVRDTDHRRIRLSGN